MDKLRNVTGTWRGAYRYERSAPMLLRYPVPFALTLKQGWFGHFTGAVTEEATRGMPGTGVINGYFSFPRIEFTKGPFKNNFRFWRERRRARCETRGGSIPQSGGVTHEQRSRWPDAAPPLPAGALWLAGFVAHSSQTAAGMLVARASPASQIASSKIGIYFLTNPYRKLGTGGPPLCRRRDDAESQGRGALRGGA